MITADATIPVRRAILSFLKADPSVTALVPAERIYPPQTPALPAWPFIRYGTATVLPFRSSCMNSSRIVVAVHGFAKGPGDDAAGSIGKALGMSLDGASLPLAEGTANVTWTGSQILQDPEEASAWHAVVNLEVVVAG